ncbi:Gmad2 immunoglobulin-like domain-containing protein [Nocardioides sp. DS6]|uniref:Gmad2 immunoglobulin-like domain-containing protein n=1 Tax=Nocardioides eburneus TaxID=3231482 RepID=A0ABV3SZM7_9ACTN
MSEQTSPVTTRQRLRLMGGVVSAAGALAALAACGGGSSATDPAAQTSPSSPAASSPAASSSTDTGSSDGSSGATTTVPVYLLGDSPTGPRLFRDSAEVPQDAPLTGAVQYLMSGRSADPDYRSAYHSGAFGDVTYDTQKGFTVALADDSLEQAGGMSKKEAMVAVQQLVYTLEAVQGTKNAPVTVVADGAPTRLFGLNTANGLEPVDELDVLNLVNVLSPGEGGEVSGSFVANGLASSPEATVPWTVTDSKGKVVKKGFATADGWMDKLYPWKATVDVSDLAPGDYTFTASTDDPSGGAEGHGPSKDTKTITVS